MQEEDRQERVSKEADDVTRTEIRGHFQPSQRSYIAEEREGGGEKGWPTTALNLGHFFGKSISFHSVSIGSLEKSKR